MIDFITKNMLQQNVDDRKSKFSKKGNWDESPIGVKEEEKVEEQF